MRKQVWSFSDEINESENCKQNEIGMSIVEVECSEVKITSSIIEYNLKRNGASSRCRHLLLFSRIFFTSPLPFPSFTCLYFISFHFFYCLSLLSDTWFLPLQLLCSSFFSFLLVYCRREAWETIGNHIKVVSCVVHLSVSPQTARIVKKWD